MKWFNFCLQIQLAPLPHGFRGGVGGDHRGPRGEAVQVDPLNHKLKPPGTNGLKLTCDIPVSISAFKFNLRRYTVRDVAEASNAPCVGLGATLTTPTGVITDGPANYEDNAECTWTVVPSDGAHSIRLEVGGARFVISKGFRVSAL